MLIQSRMVGSEVRKLQGQACQACRPEIAFLSRIGYSGHSRSSLLVSAET